MVRARFRDNQTPEGATMDDFDVNQRSRRRWLAVLPPFAIGLLMVGSLVMPPGLDQAIRTVDTAHAELLTAGQHVGRLYAATLVILFGLGALAAAFAVIATLCSARGSTLATVAAVVAALACVCGIAVNSLVNLNLAGATRSGSAPPGAALLLVSVNTGPTATAILVAYVGGLAAASVLMAVALWRAGAGRWFAVLLPVCMILAAASPPGLVGFTLSLPVATVMALLARKIWLGTESVAASLPRTMLPA
jgi:MFS family permease